VEDRKPRTSKSAWLIREMLPHEPWLRRYLLLSSCPIVDLDDVVQDCFLKIYAAASIEQVPNPRGLLRRVARNVLIDRHRRRRGIELVGLDAALQLPSGCCPQDELFDTRRTLSRVAQAMDGFAQRRRDIVERRCLAGQSSVEAAAELGLCSSTIDKSLRASIEVLRHARDGLRGEYVDA
jgi:RNA polymerase sigma factor (sigma-70 family)